MNRILCILYTFVAILIFASCKDENSVMPGEDDPCYTIYVSAPNGTDTRAAYDDRDTELALKWEKGDVLILTTGGQNYSFLYDDSSTSGDVGMFYHYGKISDGALPANSVLSFGNAADGAESYAQTQKKNNVCREYLTADMSGKTLSSITPTTPIELYPDNNMSLIHIRAKSPGMLIGGSKLVIKGLDKTNDYEITLGDPSSVFADNGDLLDIYLIVAKDLKISQGTNLDFYLYAYDEKTGQAGTAKEYH